MRRCLQHWLSFDPHESVEGSVSEEDRIGEVSGLLHTTGVSKAYLFIHCCCPSSLTLIVTSSKGRRVLTFWTTALAVSHREHRGLVKKVMRGLEASSRKDARMLCSDPGVLISVVKRPCGEAR